MQCAACGTENPARAKFCLECGRPVAAATVAPQNATPRHLAEKILAGRDALTGERKQITVLFADIVGSTDQMRGRGEEEVQRLLDGAVQRMAAAVHQFEGTVSRTMGDGLMALFGAPIAHEDHAVRACYAAQAMLAAVRGYTDEVRTQHGAVIQIRIGLNSGDVIVRLISDDLHMDYTAMGLDVNLAARMEQLATPGTALLSPSTRALTEGFVEVRPLGLKSAKGFDPVEVYELIGSGEARTRLQVSAARGLTAFVGRRAEVAALDAALKRAEAGKGQVVALVGEPGVGKSRLVREVTDVRRARGWTVLETAAVSYGTTTPYLPVVNLLKSYFRIEQGDDHAMMAEKIGSALSRLGDESSATASAFLALLNVPSDPTASPAHAAWEQLDPTSRRRQTLDAVTTLLLRESERRPLLLVFEDLHWIDAQTQALLDGLVEGMPAARMMLLVNYRPEYQHAWADTDAYTPLRISPLAAENADQLLASLLGDVRTDNAGHALAGAEHVPLDALKRLLIERTGGNPFFLEESVRTLVETGALVGNRGVYQLVHGLSGIRMPATVQAVLAARIDRLAPAEKRLLQTAAVIGKDGGVGLLQTISGLSDAELQASLGHLQSAAFLYEARRIPELGYTFTHALTHEVAYGSLLQERRRALHAGIVGAIERLYPERLDEQVERLAHHAIGAGLWQPAVNYCRQAGRRAQARAATHEAARWFEAALAALQHLPESRETLEQSIDIRIDLRNSPHVIDYLERGYVSLSEAERYADQLGDRRRLGRILVSMNSYLSFGSQLERAMSISRRALAIGEEISDVLLQAAAHFGLGQNHHTAGDYPGAINHLRLAITCLDREGTARSEFLGSSSPLAQHARSCIAWSLSELGEFTEAVAYGLESVAVADGLGHLGGRFSARLYLGMVLNRRGEYMSAVPLLEQGRELMDQANLRVTTSFCGLTGSLGTAYLYVGRLPEAILELEQSRARCLGQEASSDLYIGSPALVEAYLRVGKQHAAFEVAHEAVRFSSEHGKRGFEGWAVHALAEAESRGDPLDRDAAEARYQEALVIAHDLGMRPLQARCRLGLGTLYRQAGHLDQARAELSTAISMLRDMGMTFWLPAAEAELAKLGQRA